MLPEEPVDISELNSGIRDEHRKSVKEFFTCKAIDFGVEDNDIPDLYPGIS